MWTHMCYIRPLKVKKIVGNKISLENGQEAYYDKKIGKLEKDDLIIVYGNLALEKINETSKQSN